MAEAHKTAREHLAAPHMHRVETLKHVDDDVRDRLRFLAYAHGLSTVERFCRMPDGSRQENSAEHSWHVGVCAMVLAPSVAPHVDTGRVLKMLAIHDIAEIEVGDVPAYNTSEREAIAAAERVAAERIFASLPGGAAMLELWHEFEQASTEDARFARAVDRLQPMLLHWVGGGVVWREQSMRRRQLDELIQVVDQLWPDLTPLARVIVDDAARRGDFAGDHPA